MIQRLQLENFKSWERADIEFGSITAFFGANSSGKTSILQLLLLLKQTVNAPDPAIPLFLGERESAVDLGTFYDILFGHDLSRRLRWSLRWCNSGQSAAITQEAEIGWLSKPDPGRMITERIKYTKDGIEVSLLRTEGEYQLHSKPPLKGSPGRPPVLSAPIKCYGFPEQVRTYYKNADFIAEFELEFVNLFKRVYYLGPMREYPKRQYIWAGAKPTDVGFKGERTIDALLASREFGKVIRRRGRARSQTVEQAVAERLKQIGLIDSFRIQQVGSNSRMYEVRVRRTRESAEVALTDIGFGVSQILPVITLCYYVPEGSILILEQPEIHLHPAVQSGLADVLIDAVRTRNLQVILESHSEHLLSRLQRRVAEEVIQNDQMKLYFCELIEGKSHLTPLQMNLYGEIVNWPKDFFGDPLGEMLAMQERIVERKLDAKEESSQKLTHNNRRG